MVDQTVHASSHSETKHNLDEDEVRNSYVCIKGIMKMFMFEGNQAREFLRCPRA
jgi:hypothetical protein